MAKPIVLNAFQYFDSNGNPAAGYKIHTYIPRTTTPKVTYIDATEASQNENPITLDNNGRGSIWASGPLKLVIYDTNGALVETRDDVETSLSVAYRETFSGTGAQTVFTTSVDLGTEEAALMVFINGDDTLDFTINGTSLIFGSAPPSGTNNIHVYAPSANVGAAVGAAQQAVAAQEAAEVAQELAEGAQGAAETSATNAQTSATNAANSATSAAESAATVADAVDSTKALSFRYNFNTALVQSEYLLLNSGDNILLNSGDELLLNAQDGSAAPTAGILTINSVNVEDATQIVINYISADDDTPNIEDYINQWDDSTSATKGHIFIRKDGGTAIFEVTGSITDNGDYATIPVVLVSSAGSLADDDPIWLSFTPKGDAGDGNADQGLENIVNQSTALPAEDDYLPFADVSNANIPKKATILDIVNVGILDQDNFASNSANHAPSQQSTKAYVDAAIATNVNSPYRVGQECEYAEMDDFLDVFGGTWLLQDGRDVSRTVNSLLFTKIGTVYGVGDNSTTFGIGDFRARSVIYQNNSSLPNGENSSYSTRDAGDSGGEEEHTQTSSELRQHNHSLSVTGRADTTNNAAIGNSSSLGTATTNNAGSSSPMNVMHPFIVTNTNRFIYAGVLS